MKCNTYEYAATQIALSKYNPQIVEMILTQLTLKVAIKMWGDKATATVKVELLQLH